LLIEKRIFLNILLEEEVVEEEEDEILEATGADTLKEKIQICSAYTVKEMDRMMHPHASFLGIELSKKETKPKVKIITKQKVKHLNHSLCWDTL